jgi:hypothetical protein
VLADKRAIATNCDVKDGPSLETCSIRDRVGASADSVNVERIGFSSSTGNSHAKRQYRRAIV